MENKIIVNDKEFEISDELYRELDGIINEAFQKDAEVTISLIEDIIQVKIEQS